MTLPQRRENDMKWMSRTLNFVNISMSCSLGTHLRYASLSARPFRRVSVHPRRRRGLSLALGVFFLGIPNGTLKALNLKVRRTCSGLLPIHILHSRRWRGTLFERVLCMQKPTV